MSTYREICSLSKDMLDESSVTKRRNAALQLQSKLGQLQVRRRLALEATPPAHKRGRMTIQQARHKALSHMWRTVIQNAVLAVQKITTGKRSKLTVADIMLPYKLLQYCDMPDEGVDNASLRFPSKLSRKVTKRVVKYCLDMLDDEEALHVAEVQLLEMMAYMCSRREYVAYFRPSKDIQFIMMEVEKRISDEDVSVSYAAMAAAGSVFQNIMTTTTELGIGMHIWMPGCIKLVASWCANMYEQTRNNTRPIAELGPLIRGLTALIRSNPEQAIAPLTRHGRAILGFCKNRYVTADLIDRNALTGYFLCHLYVCQVAGKLEGLMPGDLGSLGPASFTPHQVMDILELYLNGGGKMEALDRPFNDAHSTSLELVARLLACAQRSYLSKIEWTQLDDPTAVLVSSIEDLAHGDDFLRRRVEKQQWSSCSAADLASSPFVDCILREICRFVPVSMDSSFASTSPSAAMSLLDILAKTDVRVHSDNKQLILMLQVIGACAEAFPSGSCWSCNTYDCWHRLPPCDEPESEGVYVSACSPDDLAVVVNTIASVLDTHGGSTGDLKVQEWSLLCLVQLAETSAVQSYIYRETPASLSNLAVAWRHIWCTLFRSDLRYAMHTSLAESGSSGELVLVLLTRIVRNFCTDPKIGPSASVQSKQTAFLFHRQSDIWSLPVFTGTSCLHLPSLFELIGSVLFSVGLSDRGSDQVLPGSTDDESNTDTILDHDRRYRLLTFCLRSLERAGRQRVAGTIAACVAALTHGSEARFGCFDEQMIALPTEDHRSSFVARNQCFSFTQMNKFDYKREHAGNERLDFFECLWGHPLPDPLEFRLHPREEFGLDPVRVARWRLSKVVSLRQRSFTSADLLPHSESDVLLSFVRPRLNQSLLLWHKNTTSTMDIEDTAGGNGEYAGSEEASTVLRTWAMKVIVNVSLACREELVSKELTTLSSSLADLFKAISTDVENWSSGEDKFMHVALDLLQIVRALVEVASEAQVDWPGVLVEGASCLFELCEDLLDGYMNARREEEELPMVTPRAVPEEDFLSDNEDEFPSMAQEHPEGPMDVDSGDEDDGNRKRRREVKNSRRTRRRVSSVRSVCVDQDAAFVLASLLVSMQPAFTVCEHVAQALLGVNDIEEALHAEMEIDCLAGAFATRLCCTEAVVLHQTAMGRISDPRNDTSRKGSVVTLLCHLVQLVRINAEPDSEFYLYGYELCARVVQLAESGIRASSITKTESRAVVDLLKSMGRSLESRSLWLRPCFRVKQLSAAIDAFRVGRDTFHAQIDKDFPRYFVLPSLSDISAMVRRRASCAVAAALQVLPEEKVVESVRKRLPPILPNGPGDDDIREDYKNWYADKDLRMAEANTTVEEQVWEDAFLSIEKGVVDCWSAVAGAASSSEVLRQMLFDLIRLSFRRPGREALCFQAIEAVADKLGYPSAEDLLDEECEELVRKWLVTGESLLDLPLVFSAPTVIRKLLQAGKFSALVFEGKEDAGSSGPDIVHLRETAASEFVTLHCRTILPQILALSMAGLLEESVTKEGRRRIFEDRYMKELCSVFEDRFDDTIVLMVLRGHLSDILAFCAALKCGSETEHGIALQIEKLIESLLTKEVVQQHGSRAANLTIRRLLYYSGNVTFGRRQREDHVERFSNAVAELIEVFGNYSGTGGDIFSQVGGSRTEYLLFAKYWLNKSSVKYQKLERWHTVQLLCEFVLVQIKQENCDQLQLGFCFHLLSDVILDFGMTPIHSKALTILKQILEESLLRCDSAAALREAVKSAAKELLGVLMHTHENAQAIVVTRCIGAQKERERSLRRSLGVHGLNESLAKSRDAWGWNGTRQQDFYVGMRSFKAALADYRNQVNEETVATLKGTYDTLWLLLNQAESLDLELGDFVGASPPYEIRESHRAVLAETDPSFCAQELVKDLLEAGSYQGGKAGQTPCPVILSQLQNNSSPTFHVAMTNERKTGATFTMDQRLLRAELIELEHYLRQLRETNIRDPAPRLNMRDIEQLVRILMAYCDVRYCTQVRLAATRCLGEVDFATVESCAVAEPEAESSRDWLGRAIYSGSLPQVLRAKGIEVLCSCLRASNVKVAMVAMETLKAVLASPDGATCLDQLHDADRSLVSPFILSGRLPQSKSLFLTDHEIDRIKSFASSDSRNEQWCWDEQLWRMGSQADTSFEDWICVVVPALLLCAYGSGKGGKTSKKSTHSFLALCQRMSCFDPNFAAVLFPAIVIDLLESESHDNNVMSDMDIVLAETWIGHPESPMNSRLSDSFKLLLTPCSSFGNDEKQWSQSYFPRGLDLALDVLDTLRRLTQYQFVSSKSHQKNPGSMKAAYKVTDQKGTSLAVDKSEDSGDYDSDLAPAPRWRGVPYGVVLRLEGSLIARACIQARRFASAILYAEMFADSRFGGSTKALELFTGGTSGRVGQCPATGGNISGFDCASAHAAPSSSRDLDSVRNDVLSFLSLLRESFAELGEDDARTVMVRHISDFRFSEGNARFEVEVEERNRPASLQFLQHLDTMTNTNKYSTSARLATAELLGTVGLRNTVQTYISGLFASGTGMLDDADRSALRDRWFECRLHAIGWDDSLFSGNVSVRRARINRLIDADTGVLPKGSERLGSSTSRSFSRLDHSYEEVEFHEHVVKAFAALIRDETEACCLRLAGARNALLNRIPLLVSREASLAGTTELLGQLEALNDLHSILTDTESTERIFARWDLSDSIVEGTENLFVSTEASHVRTKSAQAFSECVRELVLRVLCMRAESNQGDSTPHARLSSYLWRQCSVNCQLGLYHVAEGALQRLYRVLQTREPELAIEKATLFQLRLQEANLLECKGNFAGAIRHLKQSITRLKSETFEGPREDILADALVTCGKWMTEYKVEPSNLILEEYLKPAAAIASSVNERKGTSVAARRATEAFIALGQLVSNLFDTVSARVKSVEWLKAGRSLGDREAELRHCDILIIEARKRCEKPQKRVKGAPKDATDAEKDYRELQLYRQNLSREVANAMAEREKILRSVEGYRNLALQSFVSALATANVRGAENISRYVYRAISLWFSSVDEKASNDGLDRIIADAVTKIPTFRFVPLVSQLFSRVERKGSSKNSSFQRRLQQLMVKMCLDHPYHCIIQLIALANGKKVGSGVSGRNADAFLENASDTKVNAAKDIMKSLKREDPEFIGCLIESYEALADAYIHLAMASTTDFHRGDAKKISFSQVCKSSAERLDQCLGTGSRKMPCPPCVMTQVPPVRPGCDYRDRGGELIGAEHVVGFENQFSITEGGLHRPKIVICLGSKGGRFKQLVKGEDEIRQDAVMEQVFGYVNELMMRRGYAQSVSLGSSNEHLKLFTYNIIPLSPASGVLEWVENSMPFGEFLTDKSARKSGYSVGAHSRYYPGEWGSTLCRDHLKNAPRERKREAFDTICVHHSPAFRFFFIEKFGHSMEAWHAAKMRYTRSVAVNSIVGHILGIGDRHGSNILIHEGTGEVVHIDFGIVFEQGKLLNSPEKVPFRLTQNIIDGFGPTGTEGTFTSAAEATLKVLKHNAGSLLTILSAIVSDPLYKWSVSPVKARERQRLTEKDEEVQNIRDARRTNDGAASNATDDPDLDKNEAAAHAIIKIQEKLQGYEDGTSGEQQSVEGQVQLLINSARDRDNLCVMFPGWAPWM